MAISLLTWAYIASGAAWGTGFAPLFTVVVRSYGHGTHPGPRSWSPPGPNRCAASYFIGWPEPGIAVVMGGRCVPVQLMMLWKKSTAMAPEPHPAMAQVARSLSAKNVRIPAPTPLSTPRSRMTAARSVSSGVPEGSRSAGFTVWFSMRGC
jgi:hypothetical protein